MQLNISAKDQEALKDLAWLSIKSRFEPGQGLPDPPNERLKEHWGAFVTLKQRGRLRGCIGHVIGDRPLWQTVADMARSAAFNDPRFPPLQRGELDSLSIELSVLGPMQTVTDPQEVVPGRHGLLVQRSMHSGLLLPQVAVEQGWDRETFLDQTCLKAGLPTGSWRDKKAQIFKFEALVF